MNFKTNTNPLTRHLTKPETALIIAFLAFIPLLTLALFLTGCDYGGAAYDSEDDTAEGGNGFSIIIQETDGKLIINDLDDYNEFYIIASGGASKQNTTMFYAAEKIITDEPYLIPVQIIDNSVTLNVWQLNQTGRNSYSMNGYSGNDENLSFSLQIFDTPTYDNCEYIGTATANFTDGETVATKLNIEASENNPGSMTITGLENYNGKFISAGTNHESGTYLACSEALIADGSAVMDVWKRVNIINNGYISTGKGYHNYGYRGNDSVFFHVSIYDPPVTDQSGSPVVSGTVEATFINGEAVVAVTILP